MKIRILEKKLLHSDQFVFVVQRRYLFFWFNLSDGYLFNSIDDAQKFIDNYKTTPRVVRVS